MFVFSDLCGLSGYLLPSELFYHKNQPCFLLNMFKKKKKKKKQLQECGVGPIVDYDCCPIVDSDCCGFDFSPIVVRLLTTIEYFFITY